MSSPESPAGSGELITAEVLCDKALEYLPSMVKAAKYPVKVDYWPLGDGKLKLTVMYHPEDNSLDVGTEESVYTHYTDDPDGYREFVHYRNVELDAGTGEVLSYQESAVTKDQFERVMESPQEITEPNLEKYQEMLDENATLQAEITPLDELVTQAFYTFDKEKLDYFMGLIDQI